MLSEINLVYHSQQIRACEKQAQHLLGMDHQVLMVRAGEAACDFLQHRWPGFKKIAVFCGNGHNGGDGYSFACVAKDRGLQVTIWQVGDPSHMKPTLSFAWQACKERHIPMQLCDEYSSLFSPDIVVDAIYGIGLAGAVRAPGLMAIQKIKEVACPVLSLDVPSGIGADTGVVAGAAVCASATITFIGLKLGLLTGAGVAHAGEVVCDDLALPPSLLTAMTPLCEKSCFVRYQSALPKRHRNWHKGLSGHVLILGGAPGFSGAPLLAAQAALRVGAGLVSIATHPHHAAVLNVQCPEIMCHAIRSPRQLAGFMEKINSVIIGPGLGQSAWAKSIWRYLLVNHLPTVPIVVDADALNLLAKTKRYHDHWILTPHPGEAARLLNVSVDAISADRFLAAHHLCQQYGGACVLKGAGTLTVVGDELSAVCDKGNPGMASAGMGDVLSGVIGGLLAQGMALPMAMKLSVSLHALAGDMVAQGGERGMIASDLLPYLRQLTNTSS